MSRDNDPQGYKREEEVSQHNQQYSQRQVGVNSLARTHALRLLIRQCPASEPLHGVLLPLPCLHSSRS